MFDQLKSEANTRIRALYEAHDLDMKWEVPSAAFGDMATPVALQLSKLTKTPPREIAQKIAEELRSIQGVEKAEVAGPGFVNLWLTPSTLVQELKTTREACTARVTRKKEGPVIVEYSQPNIAKPLGVHHILGTVIGQSVSNLYEHLGYPVVRWNYIGDWGTQFGKLAVAMEKWGRGKDVRSMTLMDLLALYVKFHEETEKDPTLEDQGRAAFLKLEQGDPTLRVFWEDVVAVTKASLGHVYSRLHVSFDLDLGESFYEDKMEPILQKGKKEGVFKTGKEGALIVEFPEDLKMPPYLVQKSDGATLYSTRDIAQMRYRMDTYHPQKILIFTDIAQKLHFEQLVETCKQLGWELPEFENVLFGRMSFADRAMSTRKGNILNLEQVLDEAVSRAEALIKERGEKIQTDDPKALAEMMGVGAVAYGVVSQNRKMDMIFDWDKMLSFEGNSAPYLQYTHARTRSVLRKGGLEGDGEVPESIDALTEKERALIATLLRFASVLEEARASHLPHVLATFLYELCQNFNAFYNDDPILQAPEPQRSLRIALVSLTANVLKTGAQLLTMRVPDRM